MSKPKIIFVISAGRSGTRSLAEAARSVPNTDVYHGPAEVEHANCMRYHGRGGDEPKKELRIERKELVNRSRIQNRHYFEVSWFLTAFTLDLIDIFPSCTVVALMRDGRDFVRSGMARPWFEGGAARTKSAAWWSREGWEPPARCHTKFSKICWLWAEQSRVLMKDMAQVPTINYGGILKLEDLSKFTLNTPFRKLGLPMVKESIRMPLLNVTPHHVIPHWSKWSQEWKTEALGLMGKELERHGYA